jgi:hypothetical protein
MAMAGAKLKELPSGVRKELEGKARLAPEKLAALGRVLQVLEGMQRRDALWVLRKAIKELGGK